MTIPTYDISPIEQGGRAQAFGGEMLLHEMKRRHIMSKAIVVTQFDLFGKDEDEITLIDLDLRLMKQFPINYLFGGVMQIIIVGCGKVGRTLAEQLQEEDTDITLIDINPDRINEITDEVDALGDVGNGASI